ncbi:hypothetical protein [Sphingopyxis sp. 113P3]|uniref:hypothetical protein n=1 Tax=Sphingopyxis sp. (strain 113P3) TaxID=292913 RepID=UPI000A4BCEA3|nr:hypothetical protein [Sphingopyxis sp. 113P3]
MTTPNLSTPRGEAETVRAIVSWLRDKGSADLHASKSCASSTSESLHLLRGGTLYELAEAIERGEHLKGEQQ